MDTPKIKVELENIDGLTRHQIVDVVVEKELDNFDSFLATTFKGTAPHLASFERAMVKTFLMFKLKDQIESINS